MNTSLSVVQWTGQHSSKVLIEVRFLSDGPYIMTDTQNLFRYPEKWEIQVTQFLSRTPLPEVKYLEDEDAWTQWDLAVKLQDKRYGL